MAEVDRELLLSVTGGLGGLVEDDAGKPVYCKDEDCLACLKDLQRFLRNDDPKTREALQILGQYNIAKTDLVPLIVTYPQDTDLVYNALKVVTFLTMPIAADSDSAPTQALYMQQVKEAFLAQDAMTVIVGLVAEPLGRHPRMSEADGFIVQLVITFIRNLLKIPDRAATAGSAGDHKSHLRQKLLMRLFEDHVMELLAVMAQYTDARPFRSEAPLLLDIFSDIFKGADAGQLAAACLPKLPASAQENVAPEAGRGGQRQPVRPRPKGFGATAERAFLAKERRALSSVGNRGAPRHARFGGMFVRRHGDEARSTYLRNNPTKSSLGALPTPAVRPRAQ